MKIRSHVRTKRLPQECGIYAIKNTRNNKVYIGASHRLWNRIHDHFMAMHNNPRLFTDQLREDIEFYGIEAFEIYPIEICQYESIHERENYYINLYNSRNPEFGYNKIASQKHNCVYRKPFKNP